MDKERKMQIISRLVKDGAIDFEEALLLWETEKEYIYYPQPHWEWPQFPTYQSPTIISASYVPTFNLIADENYLENSLFSFTTQN